ncbi:hypothetical protein KY328_00255, partial [Candidatus Woesearchaeota archaeon]|nr:hypothetical protein [Candidatus Woesearchaeota archaeon]
FGMSIYFITTIYQRSVEITPDDLGQEIQDIQCGNQKVCLSSSTKTVIAGKWQGKDNTVTVKILNILGNQKIFDIVVLEPAIVDEDGNRVTEPSKVSVVKTDDSMTIDNNAALSKAIGFNAAKDAVKGTYLYTIKVYYRDVNAIEYATKQFTLKVS